MSTELGFNIKKRDVALEGVIRRQIFTLGLAAMASLCPPKSAASAPQIADQGAARLHGLVDVLSSSGPGCAVAAYQRGHVADLYARGLADLARKTPLTPQDRADIGSVSKQFTAAAVLELARQRKLRLADPVAAYVEGLPAWGQMVSLADLLYMRSGIPDFLVRSSDGARVDNTEGGDTLAGTTIRLTDSATRAEVLTAIRRTEELDFAPRARYAYSNANYTLLREAVERASGKPLGSVIATSTRGIPGFGFAIPRRERGQTRPATVVHGYVRHADGSWQRIDGRWDVLGPSNIWMSAAELGAWGRGLLADPARLEEMARPGSFRTVDGTERGYAAGLMTTTLASEPVVYHLGGAEGSVAGLFLLPRTGRVLAFLCNMAPESLPAIALASAGRDDFERYQEFVFLRVWLGQ